jgi:Transposase Tn5 dimerisation domain/Transposase DNA-binding
MTASWASEEFETINLGDKRLDKRVKMLAQTLADKPGASIPAACADRAETVAAYRLLAHEDVGWHDVLQAHEQAALRRMKAEAVVLCLQDTTELDYQGRAMRGLGPLSYEAQRGLYVHPTYAVSVRREPLGILNAWNWAREFKDEGGKRGGVCESVRWVESYERIAQHARELPQTRLVCVGDRESDMLELMVKARDLGHPADYLVRCQHNRVLPGTGGQSGGKLWATVAQGELLGEVRFEMPRGRGRQARTVTQEIRAKRISLSDGQGGTLEVTCVFAREMAAPTGSQAVMWRLLTNRAVDTLEQASELIDWYRARWEIEMFFLILKEGCKVEQLQLEDVERLEVALALYMVIAWRINQLMRLGRTQPDMPADVVLEEDEWHAAFILNKKPVPKQVPTLNTVVRLIAQRGGFLGRKGDGQPGARTLWQGLREVAVFVEGLRYARNHPVA